MLIAAAQQRLRIAEVPIGYHPRAGESKLRTVADGWRHLRLLLVYSPRHLFVLPGLLLAAMGLAVLALLAPGPITLFGRVFDYHFMFVGSLLGILGTQVASLGLFARALKSWPRWFTLERGLLTGTILFVTGLVVNIVIAVHWIESEFGPLDEVRSAIVALTLMAVGAQILFSAFYLDLLASTSPPRPVRPRTDPDRQPGDAVGGRETTSR